MKAVTTFGPALHKVGYGRPLAANVAFKWPDTSCQAPDAPPDGWMEMCQLFMMTVVGASRPTEMDESYLAICEMEEKGIVI